MFDPLLDDAALPPLDDEAAEDGDAADETLSRKRHRKRRRQDVSDAALREAVLARMADAAATTRPASPDARDDGDATATTDAPATSSATAVAASVDPSSAPDDDEETAVLHVSNLAPGTQRAHLHGWVAQALDDHEREIVEVRVVVPGRSKGGGRGGDGSRGRGRGAAAASSAAFAFAFVEFCDAATARKVARALSGTELLGAEPVLNRACGRAAGKGGKGDGKGKGKGGGGKGGKGGMDMWSFEAHHDKAEAARLAEQVETRAEERAAWLAAQEATAEKRAAWKAACRAQGHFGFGFGPDGRPLLHAGFSGFGGGGGGQ